MIWCVAFSHESFGASVRGVTIEVEGGNTLENSIKAKEEATTLVSELNWPQTAQVDYCIPVYQDYFKGQPSSV